MELLMSFSIQRETSDGTLSTLDLTIEYIDQADVKAFVNDIEIELTGGVTPYTWEWVTPAQIKITPDVPNGLVAMVKRSTPMGAMYHNFDAGAVFKDETVDENFKQVLFLSQEANEGSGVSDIYSNVNMYGYVIGNHGAALLDGDLVTFGQYRNDSLGSGFNRVAAEAARDVAVAAKDTAVASATAAGNSAGAASTSATNAQNSASSANDSRVLAQDAATTAVAAYDSFDDRYLGPKPTDPTLDNDGNALLEGALYWNTVTREMRVYNGTAWLVAYLPATGYLEKNQNLADLVNANTARGNLGLGTAATATCTTSATDTTAGSVLKVGDFGIGTPIPTTNLNTLAGTGLFACGDVPGTPGPAFLGWWVHQIDAGPGYWKNQTAWAQGAPTMQYVRSSVDGTTWGAWSTAVDFAIIYPNGGTALAPAKLAASTRYVVTNPFPGYHLITQLELLVDGVWMAISVSSAGVNYYGGFSGDYNGSLVIVTASYAYVYGVGMALGAASGGSGVLYTAANITGSRVKVWKVKGAVV